MKVLGTFFKFLLGLASITSLITGYINNDKLFTASMHVFLFSLLVVYIIFKIKEHGIFNKRGYSPILSYAKWTWDDDKHGTYEVVRVIKCRRPVLPTITFEHGWSGRGEVSVSSVAASVTHKIKRGEIEVKYPVGMVLNEVKGIQYSIKTTDADGQQKPYIQWNGKDYTDILIFEVVLKHKEDMPPAKIRQSLVGKSDDGSIENLAEIPFDKTTKSYRYIHHGLSDDVKLWMCWETA